MKLSLSLKLILGLGLSLMAADAFAAELHVTTNRVSTPSGDGSVGNPYNSLTYAYKKARPGDVIILKNGVHYPLKGEDINGSMSEFAYYATAQNPITIKSKTGEWAVLDYSQATGDAAGVSGIYLSYGANHVKIIGIEVRNASNWGIMSECSYTTIDGCTVRNTGKSGIHIGSFDPLVAVSKDCLITKNTVTRAELKNRATDGKAKPYDPDFPWNGAIDSMRLKDSVISHNKVSFSYGEGILTQLGIGLTINNNEVNDTHSQNYYIDNSSWSNIHDNKSTSIWSSDYYRNGKPANGIALTDENRAAAANLYKLNVYKNSVKNSATSLWYWDGARPDTHKPGLKNCLIYDNTFEYAVTALVNITEELGHNKETIFSGNTYIRNNSSVINIPSSVTRND